MVYSALKVYEVTCFHAKNSLKYYYTHTTVQRGEILHHFQMLFNLQTGLSKRFLLKVVCTTVLPLPE